MPEITHFGSLDTHDKGIKQGEIHLKNGTVLSGIDEVCVRPEYLGGKYLNGSKVILATGYIHSNIFLPNL